MEKKIKRRWFLFLGLLAGFIIIGVNIFAELKNEPLKVDALITLIGSVLVFCGVVLGVVMSGATNKQIDNIKVDVNELKENMSDIVITITEQDLRDADKFEIYHNGIKDLDDKWQAKKSISMLGKSMQNISKKIMNKHFDVNNELKEFLIKITESVKEYVTSEYEYGLDLLDLEDYEILLFDKIKTVSDHVNIKNIKKVGFDSVKLAINDNINMYIKNLNGIQDLRNGQRRERFETRTKEFITNTHFQSFEAYNKMI